MPSASRRPCPEWRVMRVHWSQQPTQERPALATGRRRRPSVVVRRRRVIIAVTASVLVVGLVIAGWAGALDRVPLLNGVASALAEVAGGALLVVAWWRRDRRWLTRLLPLTLLAVGLLVGVIALLLRVTGTVTDAYPPSFALWIGAGFAAVAACPLV